MEPTNMNQTRRDFLKHTATGIVTSPLLSQVSCMDAVQKKPNILLIMADDMGYSDIGCFGGEVNTPNIDRLAGNGIRFSQFYNAARCCPTRASLMTGLYPHESGVGRMTSRNNGPGYLGYLNDSCVTIPEVLSQADYFTGMAGKWHSGAVKKSWPENRGFQRFYGIHHWVDSYFKVLSDCEIFENGEIVIPQTDNPGSDNPGDDKEWYTTDVFTDKAIEHISEALDQGKPFFQYVAYNAPHWPLEAHDEFIEKYLDMYEEGYEELRKSKFKKMQEMGLISQKWNLPDPVTPEWDTLTDSEKHDTRFRRAIYAAQIEIMDHNIGRIVEHLENNGELDNTIILFISDNGCSAEPETNWFGYQWGKNTKENYQDWRKNSVRKGASQGMAWALTSNAPFQKYKKFAHEGGISTPLIVHWPERIPNTGSIDDSPGHIVDIMATCLDVAGVMYPEELNGNQIRKQRGISLTKNLRGEQSREQRELFWEHEDHAAIRRGPWKIVTVDCSNEDNWELYNIDNDRTETDDLSAEFPKMRSDLIALWEKTAFETDVLPKPDPAKAVRNPVDK
jgi:arylsulfatase A-like enzyme